MASYVLTVIRVNYPSSVSITVESLVKKFQTPSQIFQLLRMYSFQKCIMTKKTTALPNKSTPRRRWKYHYYIVSGNLIAILTLLT